MKNYISRKCLQNITFFQNELLIFVVNFQTVPINTMQLYTIKHYKRTTVAIKVGYERNSAESYLYVLLDQNKVTSLQSTSHDSLYLQDSNTMHKPERLLY